MVLCLFSTNTKIEVEKYDVCSDQCLGAGHSKCFSEYAFLTFFAWRMSNKWNKKKKEAKWGKKTCFWACTQTLIMVFITKKQAFGVCSNQTLIKLYNKSALKHKRFQNWDPPNSGFPSVYLLSKLGICPKKLKNFLIWSPLVRRHLFNQLQWSGFQLSYFTYITIYHSQWTSVCSFPCNALYTCSWTCVCSNLNCQIKYNKSITNGS